MNDRFLRILLHPYLLVFCCIATFAQHGRSQTDSLPTPAKPQVVPPTIFATYNSAQDPMLNPPPMPCQLTQDARDEFTGNSIRQTAFAELFRNNNPALRAFLQGKPHIVGQVALLANGSKYNLLLKLVVRDPNARKSFGKIEKNAPVTLYFMNGSSMIIHNLQTSEGSPDAEAQTVTYQAVYTLEDDALKVFRKSELDRIRVSWMTGYEDYEVQQVDVLQALLRCL